MTVLRFTLTAQAPLVFSERRPDGQFRPSAPFVPGASLRGALARQMLDAGKTPEEGDFKALFTDPAAPLFRNAYPAEGVPPATAYTCKSDGGFPPDGHGVYDSLIDRFCYEEIERLCREHLPIAYLPQCTVCGGRVEAFTGFYRGEFGRGKKVTPPSQLTTRVALNRSRRVAEEGLLYSPLVIGEAKKVKQEDGSEEWSPTVFHGSVVVGNDAQADLVRGRLGELTHVGSGAARGFGRVTVAFAEEPGGEDDALANRVRVFDERIRERWTRWTALLPRRDGRAEPPEGVLVAVLLLSDAVLRQPDGWTPTVRLEPPLLGTGLEAARLLRCYANAEFRGGWNTAWGLPKDTDLAVARGSVYVYSLHRLDPDALRALEALEERGVGARRQEGFGQVRICDPFHQWIQGDQEAGA